MKHLLISLCVCHVIIHFSQFIEFLAISRLTTSKFPDDF